jgi:uncharacterized protein
MPSQVAAVIDLLDNDNTIPFIARYRKEATGELDEQQIRQINDLTQKNRNMDERRQTILATIREQGKLTSKLEKQIREAESLTALEDVYRPYKPKRRTRASIAKEKGLQGLADLILTQPRQEATLEEMVGPFLHENVSEVEEALSGAMDIIAEMVSEYTEIRAKVREKAMSWAVLSVERAPKAEDERGVYQDYYSFKSRVTRVRPHQILAINRGEAQKNLRVRIRIEERDWKEVVEYYFRPHPLSPFCEHLRTAVEDGINRLLLPAIKRDVRRSITEKAGEHAIQVFSKNLRALLLQPPLEGHTVMGIDPGYRTGCKLAIVDPTGKVMADGAIYPHPPKNQKEESRALLMSMIKSHDVSLLAIGNGTASRETEILIADLIKDMESEGTAAQLHYLIVNEAGASVYSASVLGRAELPEFDVSIRGAVSIARRVQDPLAELVKIEPKSIGVGLYQYDVSQTQLINELEAVVESVVNTVGVDVNTASPALLTRVSGIGPKLSEKIVAHREDEGAFINRKDLLNVPGLGAKTFEQAAGFLRIRGGDNPLDASAIHPESYPVAEAILVKNGIQITDSLQVRTAAIDLLKEENTLLELAEKYKIGVPTLRDILDQLLQPGRDPRIDLATPILRKDILSLEDLSPGMRLKGTVRNVVDFGAFVDIGVKQDGLLHRSQIPRGVNLTVGDIIEIKIQRIELERNRIGLSYLGGSTSE